MKKEMVIIFAVLAGFWIWAEFNLDDNSNRIMQAKQCQLAGQELKNQDDLKDIIVTAIYISFSDMVSHLAEKGIKTQEADFSIDINFNTLRRNDFNLIIVDHNQEDLQIINIYSEICPKLEENELAELIKPILEALLSYHLSGLPDEPEKEKISTIVL